MAKVVLICGKICSGKTYYTSKLKEEINAIIFSCDELVQDIYPYDLGEEHDEFVARVKSYLHKKAAEAVKSGSNVILDFGFWDSKERNCVTDFYLSLKIPFEWHYVDISDEDWIKNIYERNRNVHEGTTKDYYVDEGLKNKLISLFDKPSKQEMTVWYNNRRL